jgi:tetratricopeptide (TPR) repeat protein
MRQGRQKQTTRFNKKVCRLTPLLSLVLTVVSGNAEQIPNPAANSEAACTLLQQDIDRDVKDGLFRDAGDRLIHQIPDLEKTQSGLECLGFLMNNVGTCLRNAGQLREAEKLAERCLVKFRTNHAPDDRILLEPLLILVAVHLRRGELAMARSAIRKLETLRVGSPEERAMVGALKAALFEAEGRHADAAQGYIAVLGIWDKAGLRNSQLSFESSNNLGLLYTQQMQFREAWTAFERARAILATWPEMDQYDWMTLLNNIGLLQYRQRDYTHAETSFRQAIASAESLHPRDPGVLKTSLLNYAILLRKTKQKQEAKAIEARAKRLAANEEYSANRHIVDATELSANSVR